MPLYSRDFVCPPLDGSLTIPEVLEFHWKHNAELPIYAFCDDGKQTVTEISYLEFGRACHRVAHSIGPKVPSTGGRQVVALIAVVDTMLYQAICVGIMKAGFIPFPISPRNTAAAVLHLLKKSDCHYLLATGNTLKAFLEGLTTEIDTHEPGYQLIVAETPHFHEVYPKLGVECDEDPFTPHPSLRARPQMTDTAIYLHSSGSTGLPKAIPQSHALLIQWASFPCNITFRDHIPRLRMAGMHLPPFHTMAVNSHIVMPLYNCCTVSLFPPVAHHPDKLIVPTMPTPETILEHVRKTKANALISVPAQLQVWAQDQASMDLLSGLEFVMYSGGALSPKLAALLVDSRVKLHAGYGATEFGSPTLIYRRQEDNAIEDWAYMEFSERCKVRWMPQGDGTYECQFLVSLNLGLTHSLPVENLPDARGYATSDLFEPHPTKKHLWKIVGRLDDVIIHSSGEKTVPAPIEDIVISSPYIIGTLMFGRAHHQPGILVEPTASHAISVDDEGQVAAFRNLIWPTVEEANSVAPAFSKIFKEMILITHKGKPLPRAPKGTVMRKSALQTYNQEIEALYATVESTQITESIEPPIAWNKESITQWLLEQAQELNPGKKIGASEDLFERGFDSLSATILRRRITGAIQSLKTSTGATALSAINQNTVYNYPTADALADFLITHLSPGTRLDLPKSRVESVEDMIRKYAFVDTVYVEPIQPGGVSTSSNIVVLLTGSTGHLGPQVLAVLLCDPRVGKVYTLNRTASSAIQKSIFQRHLERFQDMGLDINLLSSDKLRLTECDFSKHNLGLSEPLYGEIRDSVDVFIHSAWRVDFNLSLASFEANIRGTRNLIELARSSPHLHNIKFIFTSSVASAQSWDQSLGSYPEEVVMDAKYSVGTGYGESKYVAERVLATSGLNFTSLRIGQICGGLPIGAWAVTDWVPIMVKSSLALGALPLAGGVISWIPMDVVSNLVLSFAFSRLPLPQAVNILHPRPIEWNAAMKYLAAALVQEAKKSLPFVSFSEWISLLDKHGLPESAKTDVPAQKLLDFFKKLSAADLVISSSGQKAVEAGGMTQFSVENMHSVGDSVGTISPLQYEDIERWVKYWVQAGLFPC
ncbi:hypothetical protein GALMADRAFT_75816 [Galerina marginata CBS 339.88]|uniref:Polyketide synthase-like phosphopantetheine-binding domain-containing protein n=1 Tax=Galerina marginata (strain CBS 339.88) TaxID=685588 RepID=A0A067SL21_GALM3|nr:hypothetical protein GALMADRAFT_75816 [Galerina marginata CBS 339.88]